MHRFYKIKHNESTKQKLKRYDDVMHDFLSTFPLIEENSYSKVIDIVLKYGETKNSTENIQEELKEELGLLLNAETIIAINDEVYNYRRNEAEANTTMHIMLGNMTMIDEIFSNENIITVRNQSVNGDVAGAVAFDKSKMEAIIKVFAKGDIHTLVHELTHISEEFLTDEEVSTVLDWYNKANNTNELKMTTKVSEAFAVGMEEHFRSDKAVSKNEALNDIFKQVGQFILDIYNKIVNGTGVNPSPEMTKLYNSILDTQYEDKIIEPIIEDQDDDVFNEDTSDDIAPDIIDYNNVEGDDVLDDNIDTSKGVSIGNPTNSNIDLYSGKTTTAVVIPTEDVKGNGFAIYAEVKVMNEYKYYQIGVIQGKEAEALKLNELNTDDFFSIGSGIKQYVGHDGSRIENPIMTLDINEASTIKYDYDLNEDYSVANGIGKFLTTMRENGHDGFEITNMEFKIFNQGEADKLNGKYDAGWPYVFLTGKEPGNTKEFEHFIKLDRKSIDKRSNAFQSIKKLNKSLKTLEAAKVFGKTGGYFIVDNNVNMKFDKHELNDYRMNTIISSVAQYLYSPNESSYTIEKINGRDISDNELLEAINNNIAYQHKDGSIKSSKPLSINDLIQHKDSLINTVEQLFGYRERPVTFNTSAKGKTSLEKFNEYANNEGFTTLVKEGIFKNEKRIDKQHLEGSLKVVYYNPSSGRYLTYNVGKNHGLSLQIYVKDNNDKFILEGAAKQSTVSMGQGPVSKTLNNYATANNKIGDKQFRVTSRDGNKVTYTAKNPLAPIKIENKDSRARFNEANSFLIKNGFNALTPGSLNTLEKIQSAMKMAFMEGHDPNDNVALAKANALIGEFTDRELGGSSGTDVLSAMENKTNTINQSISKKSFDKITSIEDAEKLAKSHLRGIKKTSLSVSPKQESDKKVTEDPIIEDPIIVDTKKKKSKRKKLAKSGTNEWNVDPRDLGKSVSFEEAYTEIKRLIPNITPEQVKLSKNLSEAALNSLSVYGMFSDGLIYLLEDSKGNVYFDIARHEAFHGIFSTLSHKESQGAFNALRSEEKRYEDYSDEQLEEILAKRFQSWRNKEYKPTNLVVKIFNKILNMLKMYFTYKPSVDRLFQNIENGRYVNRTIKKTDTKYAASILSLFKKRYKGFDSNAIIEFSRAIDLVRAYMRDYETDSDYDYITTSEKAIFVKENLKEIKVEIEEQIEENQRHLKNEKLSDAQIIETKNTLRTDRNDLLDIENALMAFGSLIKMIYPSTNFVGYSSLEETDLVAIEELETKQAELEDTEDAEIANVSDYTIESSSINRLNEMSSSIKDLISNIQYKVAGVSKQISLGEGFHILLNTLNSINVFDNKSFLEQINENTTKIQSTVKGAVVIAQLQKLLNTAEKETYRIGDKFFNITKHIEILDSTHAAVAVNENTEIELNDPATYTIISAFKSDGQRLTTDAYSSLILRKLKLNKVTDLENPTQHMRAIHNKYKSQNSVREMMSLIQSLKKDNMNMIFKNVITNKADIRPSTGISYVNDNKGVLANYISNSIQAHLDVNKNLTGFQQEFKKAYAVLENSKATSLTEWKELLVPTLELFNISNMVDDIVTLDQVNIIKIAAGKLANLNILVNKDRSKKDQTDDFVMKSVLEDINSIINSLATIFRSEEHNAHQEFIKDSKGNKRYLWNASDFASDVFRWLTDKEFKGKPNYLNGAFYKSNIFIKKGIGRIYNSFVHEAISDFNNATTYDSEGRADFHMRNFNNWFMERIAKTAGTKVPTYFQQLNIISNKPKAVGVKVNHLNKTKAKEAVFAILEQHNDADGAAFVAYPHLAEAIKVHLPLSVKHVFEDKYEVSLPKGFFSEKSQGIRDKIFDTLYNEIIFKEANDLATEVVAAKTHISPAYFTNKDMQNLLVDKALYGEDGASKIFRKRIYDKETNSIEISTKKGTDEVIIKGTFKSKETLAIAKEDERNIAEYLLLPEDLAPYMHSYILNSILNGAQASQLVTGRESFFGASSKLLKRMSGVFAPGLSMFVNNKYGAREKFKAVVATDLKAYIKDDDTTSKDSKALDARGQSLMQIFQNIGVNLSDKDFTSIYDGMANDYEYTDAQGFMTPERVTELKKGFGESYGIANVHKPVYYGINPKTGEPTMFKYSSIVITNYLAKTYPKLKVLRDNMRKNQVDEMLFVTGVKVGSNKDTNIDPLEMINNEDYEIAHSSIHELDNRNYRLQFNPAHKTPSQTVHPSQLSYFLQFGEHNKKMANNIYNAIRYMVETELEKMKTKLNSDDKNSLVKEVLNLINGEGKEMEHDLVEALYEGDRIDKDGNVKSGISMPWNIPSVVKALYTQFAASITNNIQKITYPGGKFVLQSAYGVMNPSTGDPLTIKKNDNKKGYYAEVLIDKGAIPKEMADRLSAWLASDKKESNIPDIFLSPDMMAFRVPSSELHSAMPLKVVGFTTEYSLNTIVAPKEIVELHGSDYDVDALFLMSRATLNDEYVGYHENSNGQYIFEHIENLENDTSISDITASIDGLPFFNKLVTKMTNVSKELIQRKQESNEDFQIRKDESLEKIKDKIRKNYIKNVSLENFIESITHPENRNRVMKPIEMDKLHKLIAVIKTESQEEVPLLQTLASPRYSQRAHSSSFDGLKGTGIFANIIKSMSFLSRAGEEGKPSSINQKLLDESTLESLDTRKASKVDKAKDLVLFYEQGGEHKRVTGIQVDENLKSLTVLDSLLNAAIDNVKEQILPFFNMTGDTIKSFGAMISTGVDLDFALRFMKQPSVVTYASNSSYNYENTAALLKKLLGEEESLLNISTGNEKLTLEDLKNGLQRPNGRPTSLEELLVLKQTKGFDKEGTDVNFIIQQVAILQMMEKYTRIGSAMSEVSTFLSIIKETKVFESDFRKVSEAKDNVLALDEDGEGDFLFDTSNIYEANPHLIAYDNTFEFFKAKRQELMLRYDDNIAPNVYKLFKRIGNFNYNKDENIDKDKKLTSFMDMFATSLGNEELTSMLAKYESGGRSYIGVQALDKRTEDLVKSLQSTEIFKDDPLLIDFISRIQMKWNRSKNKSVLNFFSNDDVTSLELLRFKMAFEKLKDYSIKDGKIVRNKSMQLNNNSVHNILIEYTIVENGLNFSSKNLSRLIPGRFLKTYYYKYEKALIDLSNKGIAVYEDMAAVNIALKDVDNNNDNYLYKNSSSVRKTFGHKETLLFNEKEEELHYDLTILNKDNAPKFIVSQFTESIQMAKDRVREENNLSPADDLKTHNTVPKSNKAVYVKFATIKNVDNIISYYKRVASSKQQYPSVIMDHRALNKKYFAAYQARPDLPSLKVANNINNTIVANEQLFNDGTAIGTKFNVTNYNDNASYNPKVYEIKSVDKEKKEVTLSIAEDQKSSSPALLNAIAVDIVNQMISLHPDLATKEAIVDKLMDKYINPKFNVVEGMEDIISLIIQNVNATINPEVKEVLKKESSNNNKTSDVDITERFQEDTSGCK